MSQSGGDNETEYFKRLIHFDYPQLVVKQKHKFSDSELKTAGRELGENEEASADDDELSVLIYQKWDSDESGVVWDASLLLAKYLEKQCYLTSQNKQDGMGNFANYSIIELGSGTGFLGIWLAAMGAQVLFTDLEPCLKLIQKNVDSNLKLFDEEQICIKKFDWFDKSVYSSSSRLEEQKFLDWKPIDSVDFIIVSDCLYYKEGMEAIYRFINWVLGDDKNHHCKTKFLISYEDREDKVELLEMFIKLLEQNSNLLLQDVSKEDQHPDYCSDDLHLFVVSKKNKKEEEENC